MSGGQKDLENKLVRAIGNPHERFFRRSVMDDTRCSLRYALTFYVEDSTKQAIKAHAKDLLPAVAIERIWQEFYQNEKVWII